MKIKRLTKRPEFESHFTVKIRKISEEIANPFADLMKKKLTVPITLFHL